MAHQMRDLDERDRWAAQQRLEASIDGLDTNDLAVRLAELRLDRAHALEVEAAARADVAAAEVSARIGMSTSAVDLAETGVALAKAKALRLRTDAAISATEARIEEVEK